jgi:hypothetical protein
VKAILVKSDDRWQLDAVSSTVKAVLEPEARP